MNSADNPISNRTSGENAENQLPASGSLTLNVDDGPLAIAEFQDQLNDLCSRSGYDESARFAVRLAIEEALVNAFRHGNGNRPGSHVTVDYSVTPEKITVQVTDEGEGFDPGKVPDPTEDERLGLPTGRGILIMRAFMTDVSFNKKGNTVTLVYKNPAE